MKNKKTMFIALGSIALVIALFVGSYIIRQNQYQAMLSVSTMMNSEDVDLTTAEYGTMAENETADNEAADEIESGSESSAEPAAKLDKMYEDAMEDSDLEAYEIELIRSMVGKENKTFEEALQAVRPGSKIVQEQPETQAAGNNQNPQQPITPTKPTDNNNNTQKPTTTSTNNAQSIEKKRAVLMAGIEKLKAEYPGYDEEWDIFATEYYTDEKIRDQVSNPLDDLALLEMQMYQREGKPPMKYTQEYERCEWKHMPTFTADMEEHDSEKCCICTPELADEGEHVVRYSEGWWF